MDINRVLASEDESIAPASAPPEIISLTPSTARRSASPSTAAAPGAAAASQFLGGQRMSTSSRNGKQSKTSSTADTSRSRSGSGLLPGTGSGSDYFPLLRAYGGIGSSGGAQGKSTASKQRLREGTVPMFGSVAGANWPAECGLPSAGASSKQQVWLIFGATGTIGSQICRSVLERGDVVVACSRNVMTSVTVPPEWADRLLTIGCDIRLRSMVKEVVDKTLQRWNRIDVVVNTVSVGVVAPCEEQDEHDVREQFETNVMGLFHIIQTTVPYMRMRGKGRYVIISGIAGMLGVPGMGPFCGTKWAVEGMIETLAYEIEGFGGKATLVYPGTVEEDATTKRAPAWRHFVIKPMGEAYQGTPAEHARRLILWVSAHRATGVAKIGEIIWELAQCKQPPMRLLLGSETVETMRNRLRQNVEEVEDWKFLFTEEE